MSTPIILHEADTVGRVHTVYSHDGHALFDFIVDSAYRTTVSGCGFKVTNTKQQLIDQPLGDKNGN